MDKNEYNFEQYKIDATKHDIKKFEEKLKPKIWENIPIIGPIVYSTRIKINTYGIDRGPLRKNIMVKNLIFLFAFFIYGFVFLSMLTPWFLYSINKQAIKKTKNDIENQNL